MLSRRLLLLFLLVLVQPPGVAAQDRPWLVLVEAIPAVGIALPRIDASPYEEREALAEHVRETVVPQVAGVLGLSTSIEPRDVTPGGWLLSTQPTIPVTVQGAPAAARMAAALGYVLRQSAVLTVDLADGQGGTGFGLVALPDGAPDPALTQQFFLHAAGIDRGLSGGYTALPVGMLFLNLRDPRGRPYGGLEDASFIEALRRAAASFADPPLRFERAGNARAVLVANDWKAAPDGARYRAMVGDDAVFRRLEPIQLRHGAIVLETADRFGWR